MDPALPTGVLWLVDISIIFVQKYGWVLLIGGVLTVVGYRKIAAALHIRATYDKNRVTRIDSKMREARARQQEEWDKTNAQKKEKPKKDKS